MSIDRNLNRWLAELEGGLRDLFSAHSNQSARRPTSNSSSTHDDELAFLAYTGKIENHVRDKLAFSLHRSHSGAGASTGPWYAREYCRVDLVKGTGGKGTRSPKEIQGAVQAKAIYVADLYGGKTNTGGIANTAPHPLLIELAQDIETKSPDKLGIESPVVKVGLLLVTDFVAAHVPLRDGIKYEPWVANQLKNKGLPAWEVELRKQLVTCGLKIARPLAKGSSRPHWGGQANGCDIAIHWFLITPK